MKRSRALGAGSLVLAGLGAGLLLLAVVQRRDASDALREGSYRAVSRTRALDAFEPGDADDRAMLDRWIADAAEARERRALRALRTCAPHCAAAVRSAREQYARSLEAAWSAAAAEEALGERALLLAALLLAAATLVALRRAGPAPPETPEAPAESEAPSAPGVEALLRQRLEELYAARKRAWESERFAAYGELAAGLSHGLKTPLASIRAATQVAIKRLGDDHPATPQLRDVIDEVDGLVEQVKRFLQATGTGAPVPARLSAHQLVEAIAASYGALAEERGLSLIRESDLEARPDVLVDGALLELGLRNLVENALAAAPQGTEVRIAARRAEPPSRAGLDNERAREGEWIEIAVSDRGAGIPDEVLGAQRVVSRKSGGNGLGLAIARRIVERHGGALVVETSPETGTVVRAVLPVDPGSAEEAPS